MTEVSVGALFGTVELTTVSFDRGYARVVSKMADLGARAGQTAVETTRLDEGLTAVSSSATKASTSIARASKAAADGAASEEKAAAAAQMHARAQAEVAGMLDATAAAAPRVQQATLRLAAAEERLLQLTLSGTASTRDLAGARAGVIGATDRLAAAENAAAAAAERESAAVRTAATASRAAAVETTGLRGSMGGLLKTAAELGLVIGAIELVKKSAEFVMAGRDLTTTLNQVQAAAHATDAAMVPVRAQVIGLGHDLTVPRATAVDAAEAIDDLVRSGMTLPRAMAAARSSLLLMSVTQTDAMMSARVLGDALDEFRLPASQAAKVASMLGAAATASAGGLESVFDAMKYAGSRARAAKIPMSDLLASIVDLSKAGIQGSIAGTGLAMVIARLASKSAPTVQALKDLGIEAWDAQGRFKGLPFVVESVSQAQKRFGPNSKRFLSDLQAAFGARAANVMAAFAGKGIEGIDRFQKRIDTFDLQGAADKMNRGFGAAMGQITKQLTALGIDVYQKVEPALSDAAMWLGTSVPHAIGVLAAILGPTVHTVGVALVGAWHAVVAVLGPVASGLGSVGHFLADHASTVKVVTTALLAMWAAYKGYVIATTALRLINGALLTLRLRSMMAGSSTQTLSKGTLALGTAMAAVGLIVAGFTSRQQEQARQSALNKAAIDNYTTAIEADSGALGKNVRAQAEKDLADAGAYQMALKMGITQSTLTDALLGNGRAATEVKHSMLAYSLSSDDAHNSAAKLAFTLNGLGIVIGEAKTNAHDLAAANKHVATTGQLSATAMEHNADAARAQAAAAKAAAAAHATLAQQTHLVLDTSGNFVHSTADVAKAADAATKALDAQTTASKNLKLAEDLLNGVNESLETATDSFSIAVGNLANKTSLATDANGNMSRSLKQGTVAGATNRQMLVGLIDAAKTQAQATADQAAKHHSLSAALIIGNNRLKANEDAIRAAAKAAGLDKGETDNLINSLGILSKVHPNPKVDVNTAPAQAKTAAIQQQVNDFRQKHAPELRVDPTDALHVISDINNGIANLHDKDIYIDVHQRVLGAPIPRATGGYGGPAYARHVAGMISGPGTGTSDTAGLYKLSNREFVSTAASVARNAAALEAGNRGASLVALDGIGRKLLASSARASVPVSRPVAVPAASGVGMDWTPVLRRLDAIEARLADAPARTGAVLASVGADLYDRAGQSAARTTQRYGRKL